MERYKILTVTYKNVQLSELRNYLIVPDAHPEQLDERLAAIKTRFNLGEIMYLSTCNRVTYFFTSESPINQEFISNFFLYLNPLMPEEQLYNLHSTVQVFQAENAIQHLVELAASIDSMVVGEREIIRQLREAYEMSNASGLTGDNIRLAMKYVIPAAKKILTETKIAEKPVSVVSLAIQKLKGCHLDRHARIILIGAGQTIHLVSTYLSKMGFHNFFIFNRTFDKAKGLADKIGGHAFHLNELPFFSGGFDMIISCTGSVEPVVNENIYNAILNGDKQNKIIVDLAVPQDIDQNIIQNFSVNYIEIASLSQLAAENMASRKEEREKAIQLVEEFVLEYRHIYRERQVEKAHAVIPEEVKKIRDKAVDLVYKKEIEQLDAAARETLEMILNYIEKKYVALPITYAKRALKEKRDSDPVAEKK